MAIGELNAAGAILWVSIVALAGVLALHGRTQALRHSGERAFKERRTALLVYLLPLASLVLTGFFVGAGGALAGEGVISAPEPPVAWRTVALSLMLANATGAMVSCALIVLGMLRDTSNGRVLLADVMTATAGLVSLWAVSANFPQAS